MFDRHFKAFTENNMEAVMTDYAEDAIVIVPDSAYVGKEQIRSSFIEVFKMFPKEGTSLEIDKKFTNNNIAYVI